MADMSRLMKVATKPDRAEIWLVTKVTALGMSGLGLIGFLVKLVGDTIFQGKTRCFVKTHGKTGFTALAPFRLILKASCHVPPFFAFIWPLQECYVFSAAVLLNGPEPLQVFLSRLNIGIIEVSGNMIVLQQQFNYMGGAGTTAGVEQQ